MPPKKKGNNKAADDWEAELGESIAPANADGAAAGDAAGKEGEEEGDAPVGGLMAMMKKNREKRKKKGLSEDFGGEGDGADDAESTPAPPAKAPEEANMDDEFALPEKKGKGGKQNKQQPAAKAAAAGGGDTNESGRVLTKAEKEKLKKEREKQRKKEQVRNSHYKTRVVPNLLVHNTN